MRVDAVFVGRGPEQARFRAVLADPDGGRILVLTGHGGAGKTTLLRRLTAIAAADPGRDIVATVDWEAEQPVIRAESATAAGPPIWLVLDRMYRALTDAVPPGAGRRRIERAFHPFRERMRRVPALAARARDLGLDAGRRPALSDEERTRLADAGEDLAAVALAAPLGPAAAPLAKAGRAAITAAVRRISGWRVEDEEYPSLISEVDALVRAFGHGLDKLAGRGRPPVLLLDSCELLGPALDWLPALAGRPRAAETWVLGLRDAADPTAGGPAARLVAALPAERAETMPMRPFGPDESAAYLAEAFGAAPPPDVTAELTAMTGGVPLAVALLVGLLRSDVPRAEVFADGPGRAVVATLMRRYLVRLLARPESAEDLAFVHGLALLPGRLDPTLLAALWDVPPAEVAGRLDTLAARYDFVTPGPLPLHRDVAAVVLTHLSGPAEREMVRPMHERAVAALRARLSRHAAAGEAAVTDADWQRDVAALLWHTCWTGERAGHRLLCHLYAPVAVLAPRFALELAGIAGRFAGSYASADLPVLRGLLVLAGRPLEPGPADPAAAGPPVLEALRGHDDEGVLAADVRRRHADLVAVMHGDLLGLGILERLDLADTAVERVKGDDERVRRPVVQAHRRCTSWFAARFLDEGTAVPREVALRAGRRGVEVSPDDPLAHAAYGTVLTWIGEFAAGQAALREAKRRDPANPARSIILAYALLMDGRYEEAEPELRRGVEARPESARLRQLLGRVLLSLREPGGEAVRVLREADRLAPGDVATLEALAAALINEARYAEAEPVLRRAIAIGPTGKLHNHLGLAVGQLGRPDAALAAHRRAAELAPDDADIRVGLAAALGARGDHAGAEREARAAIELDPGHYLAHENLAASLHHQGRREEAERSSRRAAVAKAASGGEITEVPLRG
ncbi:tetratricopeptide repeat protein [Dactylosporangium sp. NPDC000244]|uniref:tetratricopeptide repeat protein n=1 Tax=Dactylosporangium sp. NPDC000244 TaxID=3154365 RepID=UPI0033316A05